MDYKHISKSLRLNPEGTEFSFFYDYLFWFGDLNFRYETLLLRMELSQY